MPVIIFIFNLLPGTNNFRCDSRLYSVNFIDNATGTGLVIEFRTSWHVHIDRHINGALYVTEHPAKLSLRTN